jgi:hypothetical protein
MGNLSGDFKKGFGIGLGVGVALLILTVVSKKV